MPLQIVTKIRITILVYVEADHAREGGKWDGVLYALGTDLKWRACSGPYGKGPAPKGQYEVQRPIDIGTSIQNAPYTDKRGNAWFAKLLPTFKTERSGFGIHPDGNVEGTLGCIGIMEEDTTAIRQFLKETDTPIHLFVV